MSRLLFVMLLLVAPTVGQTSILVEQGGKSVPVSWGQVFERGSLMGHPIPEIPGVPDHAVQANVVNRWPDGSVRFAFCAAVIPTVAAGDVLSVGFTASESPLPRAGIPRIPDIDAGFTFTWEDGDSVAVSAREMLVAGAVRAIYDGPVVSVLELADHSPARGFDVGPDAHRSLRPIFHVWLWHTLGNARVRWICEAACSEALQDVGPYSVSAWLRRSGVSVPVSEASAYRHPTMTRWTVSQWASTPAGRARVRQDPEEIARTGCLVRFAGTVTDTAADRWVASVAGAGIGSVGPWVRAGTSGGGKPQIGPIPEWDAVALLGRRADSLEAACRIADLGGSWPVHIREGRAGAEFQGHPLSTSDRPSLKLGTWAYAYTRPEHRVTPVGPILAPTWKVDRAHLPNMFAVPALLTADPHYIESAIFTASWGTAVDNGAATNLAYGRGPTGREGNIATELRGEAWGLLQRAHAGVVAPDWPWGDRLAELVLDELAAEEAERSSRLAPGSPLASRPVYQWQQDRPYDYRTMIARGRGLPPANDLYEGLTGYARTVNGVVEAEVEMAGATWQMSFLLHAWHRCAVLGFPAERLVAFGAHNVRVAMAYEGLAPARLHSYVRPLVGRSGQRWLTPAEQVLVWPEIGRAGNYIDYATPGVAAAEWAVRSGILDLATCPLGAAVPEDFSPWEAWLGERARAGEAANWSVR